MSEKLTLTGLAPATTYHYRLAGENAAGTEYGADMSFTTQTPAPPVVPTGQTPPVAEPPVVSPPPKPKPKKCKKGFRKTKVAGKVKCKKKPKRKSAR